MAFEELKNKIAIAGIGYTEQGKVPGRTAVSFHCEAVRNAIEDAGIDKKDVDALLLYRHFDAIGNPARGCQPGDILYKELALL